MEVKYPDIKIEMLMPQRRAAVAKVLARRAQLASQLLALLNKAHKQPTVWVYLMDTHDLRVSLTDPDSPEHEVGKNEFSIPFQEEHVSATVNTVRNVLERLGVEVKR